MQNLYSSVIDTIRPDDKVRIYIGINPANQNWESFIRNTDAIDIIHIVKINDLVDKHEMFSKVMFEAYLDGAHFIVNADENTTFIQKGWIDNAIQSLRLINTQGIGVRIPTKEKNASIKMSRCLDYIKNA